MGKKLVSKTAKILSETRKSKENEAVAIAYEHIPRNPEEQAHGSLYAVIELEDSGGHAEEIAESIIDVLHKEYYEDTTRDSLSSFEAALAKINEELAERSGEGQIHWLGKLNAVLGVLSESTLHLTQTGKAEAYLYRTDHEMQITEDLAGDSVNPLRTFINVASGELTEKDRVAIVTPGVFYKISKSELKKYATASTPRMAVEDLSKILAGENGTAVPNAVLLLEMVSPESFAVEPEPETTSEAWIKEDKKPLEEVSDKSLHGAAKAIDFVGTASKGAAAFLTTKALPAIKSGASKIYSKFRKQNEAERIIIDSEERVTPKHEPQEIGNLEVESGSGILEDPIESSDLGTEIRIKEQKPRRLSLERFNFSGLGKFKDNFGTKVKKLRMPGGKFSFVYLTVGVLLIGALLGYLIISNNQKTELVAAQNIFNQAKEKYELALSEISSGERTQALEDLTTAEKLANDAKGTKSKKSEAEVLLAEITSARDKALGIIKNTATVYADFGKENLGGLFTDGTLYYGINYTDGSVYAIDPKSKLVATITEKPTLDGQIKFATLVAKRKTLVVYTSAKTLYEIDLVSKKTTKQTVDGGIEDAIAISSYNTNIYLLSPDANQIYKHTSTATGYGKKTAYATKAAAGELTSAQDLAIDSNVYVLSLGGNILKYTAGVKQTYTINGLPGSISEYNRIFADVSVKGQYLFSTEKVLKIDGEGNFVAQYTSDELKDIKGLLVSDKANTMFALSGNGKLYSISF